MKLFNVTKNGRKGEWFDDAPLFVLGEPTAYTLPHYPDYTVYTAVTLYDCDDVSPLEFGVDALIFCSGKDGDRWKWHMLISDEGIARGRSQGWLDHPTFPRADCILNVPQPSVRLSWWRKLLAKFR